MLLEGRSAGYLSWPWTWERTIRELTLFVLLSWKRLKETPVYLPLCRHKYILAYLPVVAFYYRGRVLMRFNDLSASYEDLRNQIANITGGWLVSLVPSHWSGGGTGPTCRGLD